MAMTSRGRSTIGIAGVLAVIAIAAAVVILGGKDGNSQAQSNSNGTVPGSPTPSPIQRICPLTGLQAGGGVVPSRPVLAVKVENLPAARPQTGLSWADMIYEEPVESGITRFIVVYQCEDATRIEPIRSGRLTDPLILVQFGEPVF